MKQSKNISPDNKILIFVIGFTTIIFITPIILDYLLPFPASYNNQWALVAAVRWVITGLICSAFAYSVFRK
jgi:hypothetical protein